MVEKYILCICLLLFVWFVLKKYRKLEWKREANKGEYFVWSKIDGNGVKRAVTIICNPESDLCALVEPSQGL